MRFGALLILLAEVCVAEAAPTRDFVEFSVAEATHIESMAGAGLHIEKGTLEEAELVRSTMTNGITRIKLEDVGISWPGRLINGKHAHRVGRRIVSVEGFVRFRYKNAIAHEWDPADPLRVAKHTNEMALRDPLLAAVPVKPLIATCAKSHLQSWLQALKSGAVYWDDTGELMVPPGHMKSLIDHLENGLYYEVLQWKAVKDHEDAVRQLIAGDNFDAAFALGQTDLALLEAIHASTQVAGPEAR